LPGPAVDSCCPGRHRLDDRLGFRHLERVAGEQGPRAGGESRIATRAALDQGSDLGLDLVGRLPGQRSSLDRERAALGDRGLLGAAADQRGVDGPMPEQRVRRACCEAVRLVRLAGGPELIPVDDRFANFPLPLVVHIVGAGTYAVVGAF
jgi:hypothetical protein